MTTSLTCIIAYTAEDDRFAPLRRAAVETAQAAQARLILYDIDAAQLLASPRPNEWSGDGADQEFPSLLMPDDLERAGRHAIATQVREARNAGVDAYAWLPAKKGADALAEYADEQGADLIMMPHAMEEAGLFDRLRGATVDKAAEATGRPIAVVNDDGEVQYR